MDDAELDPSFVELTVEEEQLLKDHTGASSSSESSSESEDDESFFTLDELESEFNEVKVTE